MSDAVNKPGPRSRHLPAEGQRAAWLRPLLAALFDLVWCGGLAPVLVVLAFVLSGLAYQMPVAGRESLVSSPTPLRLGGVYRPEAAPHGFQRWTTGQARIVLPGVGPRSQTVQLRLFGGAEPGAGRSLRIATPGQTLFETELRPHWQELRLALPPGAADRASGDLTLLITTETFVLPPDERALGVSLDWIEVRPAGNVWALPPLKPAAELALVVLLSLWALRLIGVPSRVAALPTLLLLAFFSSLLAGWPGGALGLRMQAALGLPLLLQVLPLSLLLALALRILVLRDAPRPTGLSAPTMLRLAVLLIFTLRLAGTLHPQFMVIDQGLRANQLLMIAAGQEQQVRERLEQQYEWGTREPVPYSLLTYYILLPLTAIWPARGELMAAVKVVTALLEATLPLLMLALLRGGPQRLAGAAWGGLVYAALPAGYLFFHDGSFPTTIGIWLTMLALGAVQWLVASWLTPGAERAAAGPLVAPGSPATQEQRRAGRQWLVRGGLATLALALATGAYVTHVAFVPFLGATLASSLALLGGAAGWRASCPVLISVLLGLLLAWGFVYGSYTLTLVQRTIPSYLGLIASEGSVGRDTDAFFGTPINSFSQHLAAHFRVWPILLAGAVLVALVSNWRERFVTHLGLAYAALFVATSVAERWFGLWNKHMVFVAPIVAMLAGIGLAWLWRRGWGGRLVSVTLLALLFWESLIAWGNRVLWYIIPPSAL